MNTLNSTVRTGLLNRYLKPLFLSFAALCAVGMSSGEAKAEVNVNINVQGPPVVAAEPVNIVAVPRSEVYYVADPGVDIFYYGGAWYSLRGNVWYRAGVYGGPWVVVKTPAVPRAVVAMPPNYRVVYSTAAPMPYGQWKKTYYKPVKVYHVDGHHKGNGHYKEKGHKHHH